MRILLANPRGFCAGVDRAIEVVEHALRQGQDSVYVRHEIVHNKHVVADLRQKGATFVDQPEDAPPGSLLIYSAHGVSPAVREAAERQKLSILDATCPLVTKVHNEVIRMRDEGLEIIMIGHAGHVEVEGTMGHAPQKMHLVETVEDIEALRINDPEKLGCVTQTTLSVDDTREIMNALRERFPKIQLPRHDDICYATQNRQDAVKKLARECQLTLIVGASASSNSNRLVEVSTRLGTPSRLINDASEIDPAWLRGAHCVGISAGASTPDFLVQKVVSRLKELSDEEATVDSLPEIDEGIHFKLPLAVRD